MSSLPTPRSRDAKGGSPRVSLRLQSEGALDLIRSQACALRAIGRQHPVREECESGSGSRHPPDEALGFQEDGLDGAKERAGERLNGEGGLEVRGGAPTTLGRRNYRSNLPGAFPQNTRALRVLPGIAGPGVNSPGQGGGGSLVFAKAGSVLKVLQKAAGHGKPLG